MQGRNADCSFEGDTMARHHDAMKQYHRMSQAHGHMTDMADEDGMIKNDYSQVANMPQNVMMKPWPDGGSYMPEKLDDTITGVNKQVMADDSKRNSHLHPKKV